MSYDRSQVICYCDADQGGGMSACTKCNEDSLQKFCWFYEKAITSLSCTHLGFGEFCKNTYAINFSNGKDVAQENIPNINSQHPSGSSSMSKRYYIDTPSGARRIYKTEDGPGRERYTKKRNRYQFLDEFESDLDYEEVDNQADFKAKTVEWNVDSDEQLADLMCEFEKYEDAQMDQCVVGSVANHERGHMCHPEFWRDKDGNHPEPCTVITVEDVFNERWTPVSGGPNPFGKDKDGNHPAPFAIIKESIYKGGNFWTEHYSPFITGEAHSHCIENTVENAEDRSCRNHVHGDGPLPYVVDGELKFLRTDGVPVDYSGSLTHEEWDVLSKQVAEEVKNQKLTWYEPINMSVTTSYLQELMEGMCAAYSKKYGLFLDMSNPNLYTIYKADGHFISLRQLYRDGVYPMNMNFKMIDGTPQDELDFEPFIEQAALMVSSGR